MREGLCPGAECAVVVRLEGGGGRGRGVEEVFGGFVADEEEGGAGGGADEGGAHACVDPGEAAGGAEAGCGLEAGF